MKKLTISIFLFITVFTVSAKNQSIPEDIFPLLDLIATSIAVIESDYVEEANNTNMIYSALHAMLHSLDPHSEFMEPDASKELKIDTKGEFGGIGIEIGFQDEYPIVIAPIEDTPAFDAGLMPKDKIIKIEDESTRNLSMSKIIEKLRGEPGTKVNITIVRNRKGTYKTEKIEITRAVIKIRKVREIIMIDQTNKIGYIRIIAFDKQVSSDLRNGIDSLITQGMDSLILDLRNNGGGLLDSAVDVAGIFLQTNQVIVSTRGRIPGQNRDFLSPGSGNHYTMPLVILINGASASASEIVCGAIKDHRRGVIVGSKTYGKGSVQTVLPIGDGECSLRLTTAKYYTPSGVCIHGTGIYPNVEVKLSLDEEIKLIQKKSRSFKSFDIENATSEEKKDYEKLKRFSDVQLERAVDILKAIRFISGDKYESLFISKPVIVSTNIFKPIKP